MSDDFEYSELFEPEDRRPRDSKVDEAKAILLAQFFQDSDRVYYGRQLEIMLEKTFFHWITKKALNELVQERLVNFEAEKLGQLSAHFYWSRRHRYARRARSEGIAV